MKCFRSIRPIRSIDLAALVLLILAIGRPAMAQDAPDFDADGVPNDLDGCPTIFDPEQEESCAEAPLANFLWPPPEESPLPPPDNYLWRVLYDVDFEDPPHRPDWFVAIDLGLPPREGPTSRVFGQPWIVAKVEVVSHGPWTWTETNQVLDLDPGDPPRYEQVQFDLATSQNGNGFEDQMSPYYFELTATLLEMGTTFPLDTGFTILVDNPQAHQVHFGPDGSIVARVLGDSGYSVAIGTWEIGVPVRVAILANSPGPTWEIWLDGVSVWSGPYPRMCGPYYEGQCMQSLRLNAARTARAEVDDVLVMGAVAERPIDVDPDSEANWVQLGDQVPFSVALLGDGLGIPAYVDPSSLRLGDDAAEPIPDSARLEDVNGDSFPDLVAEFIPSEAGIAWGDREVCLTGRVEILWFEEPFMGCDRIRTWGRICGLGFELVAVVPVLAWLRARRRRSKHAA